MTEKYLTKKTKLRTLFTLLLVLMLSFTVFFITACDDEVTEEETTYTKVENDDSDIVNGSFEFGTADTDISDLPKTSSLTGWGSASTENSSTSSSVSSGIISIEDEAWETLTKKLYDNSTFKSKINTVYGIDADSLDENAVLTALKEKNPKTHDGAEGSKVYMLNAYSSNKWGTAITVSSTSTITLEKGTYGKISFWVKVPYAGEGYKINFRLKNTFNSNSQSQYILSGIGNGDWQQYVIYLKADKEFSSTFTPVISIGYTPKKDNTADLSEGTAFFDDIVYTEIKDETTFNNEIDGAPVKTFVYNSKENANVQNVAGDVYKYVYDMTFDAGDYFTDIDFLDDENIITTEYSFTGNSETSENKFGATNSKKGDIEKGPDYIAFSNIEHASVSLKLENNNDLRLSVPKESYLLLSFDVENNLDKSGSTDITFLVYDEEDNENSVITYSKAGETEKGYITILNNDHDVDADDYKTFYIVVVIGPTDVKGTSSMYDFASGSVSLKNFKFATGKIYQYEKDADGNIIRNPEKTETDNYKYYSLFSSVASSVSIDNHVHESADSYYLSAAKSAGGQIVNNPVAIENYKGVSYDSIYVNKDGTKTAYNERAGYVDIDDDMAGLINSKVANDNAYGTEIKEALNYSGEKSIQPIMIYNKAADSYGFIGKSFTVAASSYAAVSVKVRVVGGAKANVYLINAADTEKPVYSISFKGNVKGNSYDETFTAPLAFTNITSDKMDANGWTTLTFYVATGATALDLRLELWNGSRDGAEKSQGFVFFAFDAFTENETFTPSSLSSAFTEPSSVNAAFTDSGNPLYDNNLRDCESIIKYQRALDPTEIKYNSENPDSMVSYDPTYIWAKNDNVIYAVYNTIDPVAVDPYATDEEEETESGCTAESDPSTFWLSFSSILLGVALVLALAMLIIKNVYRRKKANKSDAKSHYNVSSRISNKKKTAKTVKADKADKKKSAFDGYEDEKVSDEKEEITESTETVETETAESEQTSDEYVYGEVNDFGDEEKTDNAENTENVSEENKENKDE